MASWYKLRCSIYGHEKDVRGVFPAYFPENAILSVSRDHSGRVWTQNEHDTGYSEGHCMQGHGGFVTSVCMMPQTDEYPHGLIMTGGQDKMILAFTLDSPAPVFQLEGHADTVCALAAGKFGTLLSGSWDTTAKVWLKQKNVMTLKGHEAAVWCVAIMPQGGFMITGSADKTIRVWKAGKCERTLVGHTDCVRGLAVLSDTIFLSCANDATVRQWLITGECTNTYHGHENFIYSVAVLPNGTDFVTSGEDRTLRVWKNGAVEQTIAHPTQSVWDVCLLPNGDIVTGASDGIVRVFTTAPERFAPPEEMKAFEDQLSTATIPAQIGDIKTDQLPGPNVLLNPGKKDGQTMMVRDGNTITAHQWSASEGRWVKIGDVVGGTGGNKQLYEGKEYDFVFDVDIQEDKPPLKLPFNKGDDPWLAAHNFLENNGISQMYLDQVVKFILAQTKDVTLGTSQPSVANVDPFTGGSSYTPPAYSQPATEAINTQYSDPYTGSSSYIPPSFNSVTPSTASGASSAYFPHPNYLSFDAAKPENILGKLRQFNATVDSSHQVDDACLSSLESLMAVNGSATATQLKLLWQLLQWPADVVFPVLDVARLAVRIESVNQHFFNAKDGPSFLEKMFSFITPTAKDANQMLILRLLCNAFKHRAGRELLLSQRDSVISTCLNCAGHSNKNIAIALSTIFLNYAVAIRQVQDIEAQSQCLSAVANIAQTQTDPEGNFRLLVCVGTLVCGDENATAIALSLDLMKLAVKLKSTSDPSKVGECARSLESVLNK